MSVTTTEYGDEAEIAAWLDHCALNEDSAAAESELPSTPIAELLPAAPPIEALWHPRDSAAIFTEPWEEPVWLVPELGIGPGRPIGIAGAPHSGKNDTSQALAIAVASGRPAFERYTTRRGRVIHLTWDMGDRATRLRYRVLAAGAGVPYRELEGRLVLAVYPDMSLTRPEALRAFSKLLQGFDLAILDNVRSATPGVDENSSQFGDYLGIYGRAAQAAGCTPIYLHHARKSGGGDAQAMRGSNAIEAASGCVWLIEGSGDGPRKLTQVRQHDISDGPAADFWLVREPPANPAAYDTGAHAPIRLVARSEAPISRVRVDGARTRLLEAITANPGISRRSLERECAPMAKPALAAALRSLLDDGSIVDSKRPDEQSSKYMVTVPEELF